MGYSVLGWAKVSGLWLGLGRLSWAWLGRSRLDSGTPGLAGIISALDSARLDWADLRLTGLSLVPFNWARLDRRVWNRLD